jgi:hypothetical protein
MWTLALVLWLAPASIQAPAAERSSIAVEEDGLDAALEALTQAVDSHASTRAAFDALTAALEAQARAHVSEVRPAVLRERLGSVIEELKRRAEASLLDRDSVARLREDVLDSRAERALAWLEERARDRHATRADYEYVAQAFETRLARAQGDAEVETSLRERWRKWFAEVQEIGRAHV